MKVEYIDTDVLIIGGGTAGCYAAVTLGERSKLNVVVAEKANIQRSGCLAAGVNALNAYITPGHEPRDYVEYVRKDAERIVRDDLLISICERLNRVTRDMEKRGLVIQKKEDGNYVSRGWRNLKINGENIKLLLAQAVYEQAHVQVINHVNITDYKIKNGQVYGAYGFHVDQSIAYDISAKAVLIATGGASGLYRPNNPGFSRHKMWYSPFNTGAGYAMGLLGGAEMTTFEMRFIALRCKDTIAPTGTIAQGVHARQVNSQGEVYEARYGIKTSERVYGTVKENQLGHGPCYLDTTKIDKEQEQDLYKAYLNMAPGQTLKWIESGDGPSRQGVEIEGTEPYIVGGHTASGYWINTQRQTTLKGLYAAGDVAGGAPQKYVTGALAEGEIAAESILSFLHQERIEIPSCNADPIATYNKYLRKNMSGFDVEDLEEAMQKVMDEYAGGIHTNYQYNKSKLHLANEKIKIIQDLLIHLSACDTDDLMQIYELRERLIVCRALIAHLEARKETRWHSFAENTDYPAMSKEWEKYVNSKMINGEVKINYRNLVREDVYEHKN